MGLIDYVINTPQNTNRTILKQLINNEKNNAVYESVEELKRDGGVGWDEPGKVYTFNGDVTGKKIDTINGIQYVKIADEHTAPEFITKIVVSLNGNMVEFGKDNIRIGWNGTREGYSVFVPFGEEEAQIIYGYNFKNLKELWFIADPSYNAFVVRLEYAETTHPIDPKYLPGPVVIDLDKYGITEVLLALFQNGGGTFSGNDIEDFWEAVNTEKQLKVSFMFPPNSRVHVNNVTAVRATFSDKEQTVQVSFECIINNKGTVYRVATMIVIAESKGADITVKVDVV